MAPPDGEGSSSEAAPLLVRNREDLQHAETFLRVISVPGGSAEASRYLVQRYQVDAFLKSMVGVRAAAEAKRVLRKLPGHIQGFPEEYTVEHMLTFQQVPIGTSLLRMELSLQEKATKLFQEILKFMCVEEGRFLPRTEEVAIVQRIHALLLKHPVLRDEAMAQLQKQTRFNPFMQSCFRAWELMRLVAAAFPPSPSFAGPLSEYFRAETLDEEAPPSLHQAVLAAWGAVDRGLKMGPRKFLPSAEEIDFFMDGNTLCTVVYMYDESSEPLHYNMTTTVGVALKTIFSALKLTNFGSFGLFEVRKFKPFFEDIDSTPIQDPIFEHILLEPNRYIADIILEARANGGRGFTPCRLLLKKRVFRYTDDIVTEPTFIHLSYIQVRHDYVEGLYPVTETVAMELAALQLAAEIGPFEKAPKSTDWTKQLKGSVPLSLSSEVESETWRESIIELYKNMSLTSKDDAKLRALRILLELPTGGAIFFDLRRAVDESKVFPEGVTLGVNRRGLRFLHPEQQALLHAADLKDIEEYAANPERLYLSAQLAEGDLTGVEFATRQGEEICILLDIHIADAIRIAPPQTLKASHVDSSFETESVTTATHGKGSHMSSASGDVSTTSSASETSPPGSVAESGENETEDDSGTSANRTESMEQQGRSYGTPNGNEKRHGNGNGNGNGNRHGKKSPATLSPSRSSLSPSSPSPSPTSGLREGSVREGGKAGTKGEKVGEVGEVGEGGEKVVPLVSSPKFSSRVLPFLAKVRGGVSPLPKSKLGFSDTQSTKSTETEEVEMRTKIEKDGGEE